MTNTRTTTGPLLVPGRWELDRAHSSVGFTIRHLGVSKVRGRFSRFEVDLVAGSTPQESSVTAQVDLASIDTGNADRDAHCLAEDMIDVARRPTMSFRSTSVVAAGDRWTVEGDLTIGEVTRPLVLDVELGGVAEFPVDGSRHAGLTATGEVRRSDYGIAPGYPAPVIGDVVCVELDLQFVEPSP